MPLPLAPFLALQDAITVVQALAREEEAAEEAAFAAAFSDRRGSNGIVDPHDNQHLLEDHEEKQNLVNASSAATSAVADAYVAVIDAASHGHASAAADGAAPSNSGWMHNAAGGAPLELDWPRVPLANGHNNSIGQRQLE